MNECCWRTVRHCLATVDVEGVANASRTTGDTKSPQGDT